MEGEAPHKNHRKSKTSFKPKKKKSVVEKEEVDTLSERKAKLGEEGVDAVSTFAKLPLSRKTLKGLKDEGFLVPTDVQKQSLVFSLCGMDVVAAAKTGSGKTLAFIIPLLETLFMKMWTGVDGLGALVITPTRELAYQIFEVLNKIGKHHDFSAGLIIGGKDLKYEWNRIGQCNIMICTPGRLLQHMHENPEFNCENVQMLILDEADQCLSMGFAETMNYIFEGLPLERQTLLFSATQTREVKDLIRAGCHKPVFCSVHERSKSTTPKTLKESYAVCEVHNKFTFLWSFVRHHRKKKLLVFLATCKQVKYIYDIFCKLHPGLSVLCLHGAMHQLRRMAIYDEFSKKKKALLFATDVAARGLDFPLVDWVVQADCPEDVTTYIHRVGRTARLDRAGNSLLLVTPSEEPAMIANLNARNIVVEQLRVDPRKMQSIGVKVEIVLSKYVNLKEEAQRAFKAYLKNISLMRDKKIFDVSSVDLDAYARSLGLVVTPRVRFLEKQVKSKLKKGTESDASMENPDKKQPRKTMDFGADGSDDDDEDDFLTLGKEKHQDSDSATDEASLQMHRKKKPVTKVAAVKKLLKSKVPVNKRIVFDGEDEDPAKLVSSAAEEEGGIDIEVMQKVMKEEDRLDKKVQSAKIKDKHRKERQKEKAERKAQRRKDEEKQDEEEDDDDDDEDEDEDFDEYTQAIIDELPDPDKLYKKKSEKEEDSTSEEEDSEDNEDISEEDEEEEKEEDNVSHAKPSGKRKAQPYIKDAKKPRGFANNLNDMSTVEKEELALLLLRKGK
ncbi:putative ATP-dependent RNA helicase DDX10 isoform X2 [Oratosquilla oratoria]